ncbi:hypothetical protein GGI21_005708, partial [Coemansia aciculifera]
MREDAVAGHNEESASSKQQSACPGDEDLAIDCEENSSWHGPASSAEERRHSAVSIPDCNRSFYPESPFVPQSWPQTRVRQEGHAYSAQDSAAVATATIEQDIWAADEHEEALGEPLLYSAESYGSLPLVASDLYSSRVLQPIDECLDEDMLMPDNRSSLGDMFLHSRSEIGALSPFDMHNPSFGGMSAFGSSFFASQDLARQRCAGEVTVSDFGASRYGLQYASAYASPHPALGTEVENSFDTLP